MFFVLSYFTGMSVVVARQKRIDTSGKSILIFIAGIYHIRLVLWDPFFGFSLEDLVIWIICLAIAAGYIIVMITGKRDLAPVNNT